MPKHTQVHERLFNNAESVGHPIGRCMLWDDGHGVQTSIVKMPAGQDLGTHKHETWVQVFVLKGKIYVWPQEKIFEPGDFYFVEPNDIHIEKAMEDTEVLVIKSMPNIQYPMKPAN